MEACSLLVNLRKGMHSSSEQPLVGEEHCVTTLITAAKETKTMCFIIRRIHLVCTLSRVIKSIISFVKSHK